MEKFKVNVAKNRIIQFSKNEKGKVKSDDYDSYTAYTIYINEKRLFKDSYFIFYFALKIKDILNAKSFSLKIV
jgi:hypothetical protein